MAGWNKPSGEAQSTPKKKPSAWRGAVAGLIVVALGAVCFVMFSGKDAAPKAKAEKKSAAIKEVKPAAVTKSKVVGEESRTESNLEPEEKWDDSFVNIPAKRYKFSVLASARTNECGVIEERWRMPNGKYWRRQIDPPPLFPNASDNAIAMAIGDRSGAPIPPYPGLDDVNLDKAFAESLFSPIEIKESDSAGIVALKMAVKETRDEIARMIREGDTRRVGEILQEHIAINNHNAEMQAQAVRTMETIRQEQGEEAAAQYLEKVNEALERMGVPALSKEPKKKRSLE